MATENTNFRVKNGLDVNGNVVATGSVTATNFIGNGSGLTGVTSYTSTDFANDLATKTTDNLNQGTTNKYFSNSLARGAVSVTDSGGDGSLSYDNSTGVFTYTGPSASEVRAHFSAGTGITITSGQIATTITQYTNSDARTAISVTDSGGDGSLSYDNSTGVFTYTGPSASEVRAHFSVTDSGGDGSLSYDNSTGVFTYTGPSASEVRAHFTAGTGITITSGQIATTITQYTDALARLAVSVTDLGGDGSLSYDNSTGVFTYTGPSASEVRAHFSVTDAGGDGSLSYDNATGVYTYTGPSASEVRAHFTAGTGITITSGQIATTITQYTDTLARSAVSVTDLGGDGSLSYDNSTGVFTYTGPTASEVRAHFTAGTGITITSGQIATTITQYTDALARLSLSVTDSGGDGSLSYDNTTGVFTYTGPTASEVRAHFSAGTGVSISSGQISIGQAVSTTSNVTFANVNATGNVQIDGTLTVSGTTTTLTATNLAVSDNMLYMNQAILTTITNAVGNGSSVVYTTSQTHNYLAGYSVTILGVNPSAYNLSNQTITSVTSNSFTISNSATGTYVSGGTARGRSNSNPDLGIAFGYYDGSYQHGGFFRDASDGYFKVFKGYTPEPDLSAFIDTGHASFALADIQAANFRGALVGNASTSTTLATSRNINGVAFNGSADITITANTTNALTIGTGLSGTSFNGSSAVTIAIDSTVATLTGTQTLTNKTINLANNTLTATSAEIAAAVTDETGSGALVFATSPSLTTPSLGIATATSINSLTITTSTGTLTIANAKTLTASNTLTFTGTDSSSVAFGAGGTVAYQGGTLAQFAATTSAQLAGVISDETGSGALVFGTSPSFTTDIRTPKVTTSGATNLVLDTNTGTTTGSITIAAGANGNISLTPNGTGSVVMGAATSGTLTTSGASSNLTLSTNSGTNSGTIVITAGANGNISLTPNGTGVVAVSGTGVRFSGATSGTTTLVASAAAGSTTITMPAATGTMALIDTTQVFTGDTTFRRSGVGGALRAEAANTNDAIILSGRVGGTSSFAVRLIPASLTASQTLTLPDATGTVALTNNKLSAFAATTSAELAGVISDETGSGALVFANTPTLVTPNIGAATGTSLTTTGGGVIARQAATQDGIEIRGRAGGTSTWEVILTPGTLTADRTVTFPDTTGTVALTSDIPTVNSGTLALSIGSAAATNNTVTVITGTGFNANSSGSTTYQLGIGPALTNLAALMTTAGAGFIRRGATADTYTVDTNTYLTAESDTLATVTGRGASTTTALTLNGNVDIGTSANLSFGSQTRQMVNLWGTQYGIGVQSSTTYFRSASRFSWHRGGSHDGGENVPGSGGTAAMTLDGSSNLTVTGSLFATTKSFVIDHPTKPGMKLRYGSLEGPENGVYVRGKLKGGNVIELPDYWTKLVDPDSITVQLTPIGKHQKLYVEDIRDNRVYIANDGLFAGEINCFYYVQAERVDVDKLEVEYKE